MPVVDDRTRRLPRGLGDQGPSPQLFAETTARAVEDNLNPGKEKRKGKDEKKISLGGGIDGAGTVGTSAVEPTGLQWGL